MSTIAIVGATGTIGSRLAPRLVAAGHKVRAIARKPGESAPGIEPLAADLTSPEKAFAALDGVEGVYLTPIEGGEDPLALETAVSMNVIDAAAHNGVEHIVAHTALRANRGDTGARVLDNKTAIETALAASGVGFTIFRPPWFLQNLWLARDYLEQGVVSLPWPGDMVWGAVDIEDVVTAALAYFERGPANRGFDLLIPGGITGDKIAAAASKVLGRQVTYQEARVSTREYVESFPISAPHKDVYAELFDYFKSEPYLEDPAEIIAAVDGIKPRGIEDFLRGELFAQSEAA